MSVLDLMDWVVEEFVPFFFVKLDSFMIYEGVSLLGFSVAITVLIIVIGSILLRS